MIADRLQKLLTEENVGGIDLMIRALAGTIAIIALAMDMASGRWRWVLAFIAAVGLYTAIMRHCSPYVIMGISTKKCD